MKFNVAWARRDPTGPMVLTNEDILEFGRQDPGRAAQR